ncbi:hypothetical protein BRADI_5g03752v3 [Brachypodium distachyon]|uniref:Uncharacterized protein n=1 Tax=Brachypodium distachyon TaxID=15368 RepID=A0A2K2CFC3_BRADI|nr:hypothetical protein BRADI_5g03752v3 [Brachypodium distachyon]
MCMYFSAVHPLSCSAGSALNLRVGLVLCLCVSSCGVLFAVLAIEPVFSGVFWFALLLVLFVSALADYSDCDCEECR